MTRKPQDKHPEELLYLLSICGYSCADVDRRFGFQIGTTSKALGYPHGRAERAIATVLQQKPHLIWPSRYATDGTRLKPQPAENYRSRRRARHCQKKRAA